MSHNIEYKQNISGELSLPKASSASDVFKTLEALQIKTIVVTSNDFPGKSLSAGLSQLNKRLSGLYVVPSNLTTPKGEDSSPN